MEDNLRSFLFHQNKILREVKVRANNLNETVKVLTMPRKQLESANYVEFY